VKALGTLHPLRDLHGLHSFSLSGCHDYSFKAPSLTNTENLCLAGPAPMLDFSS